MNGLIEGWVRNPVAANLLMVGIIISGIFGFQSMEREMTRTSASRASRST